MKLLKRAIGTVCALSLMSLVAAAEVQKAPDFTAKDADGKTRSLADSKGKVVVLEFTNPGSPVTGKPGCPFMVPRYENHVMQNLATKLQKEGAVYLAINSTSYNTPQDTKAINKKYNVSHPTLQDLSGTIAKAYHAKTTPHMFVIGKDGNIVYDGALNDNPTPDASKDAAATNYVELAVASALKGESPKITKTRSYGCGIKLKN